VDKVYERRMSHFLMTVVTHSLLCSLKPSKRRDTASIADATSITIYNGAHSL